jgi:hypothetical protein
MKRLIVVLAALILVTGTGYARSYHGGRSCYRGSSYHRGHSYYRGRSYYRGCGSYYRGHSGSRYSFSLGFGYGHGYRTYRPYYSCYPSFGFSYYSAYPAYYTYPAVYSRYAWPVTYPYPNTYTTYTYPTTVPVTTAVVATAESPPPLPDYRNVKGWYHPTYSFHCPCHGFHKKALAYHSYQYDVSKD